MKTRDLAYDVAVRAARVAAPLAGATSKLGRALQGRAGATDRLVAWATNRDKKRRLVWFHAASAGEGLQARAVLRELQARAPDLQVLFTYTSPSAERFANTLEVDAVDYLPWDGGLGFAGLFDAVAPDLIVFTQKEVWPGLVRIAAERGVPVALIAATLPVAASRLRGPGRWFLGPTFARLSGVYAIDSADAGRFGALAVGNERLVVTGDPGIDSAWERASAAVSTAPHLAPFRAAPAPTLIAGSTWPEDENTLLPAVARAREVVSALRVVVVPHEPHAARVTQVIERLRGDGWAAERLSTVLKGHTLGRANAVVVDSVGFLADLYTIGSVALVGGAFDSTGLHSVLEPAAAGLAVCFGPLHTASRAAIELLAVGGAKSAATKAELATVLVEWFTDPESLTRAGDAARAYVEDHRGAARRSAEHLSGLLEGPAGGP